LPDFFLAPRKTGGRKGRVTAAVIRNPSVFGVPSNRGNICTCICSQYYTLAEIFA